MTINNESITLLRNYSSIFMLDKSSDDSQPWVMPLVLHLEKDAPVLHEQALIASAQAVATLLSDENILESWQEPVVQWMSRRIRKLTRRARGSKWDKVVETCEGVHVTHEGVSVFAGIPHPVSQTPAAIAKLQISDLDLPRLDIRHEVEENHFNIILNPDVKMSTGKAMAQVGHVAQLALMQLPVQEVTTWANEKFPTHIVTDPFYFLDSHESGVEIHDSGFTEVPAGTLTAKGWF